MPTLDQIWADTLAYLQNTTTRATYFMAFNDSSLLSANGTYVIETGNPQTLEWQAKLKPQIARALEIVLQQAVEPGQLEFVLRPNTLPEPEDEEDHVVEEDEDGFFVGYRAYYRRGYARRFKSYTTDAYHALRCLANTSSNKAWPLQETLVEMTGMSKRKLIYSLKTLISYNIVSVSKRKTKSGHSANVYKLRHPNKWKAIN